MTLRELEIGNTAVVTSVGGEGALRQHFLDMGIIPGTRITTVKYAPMGDPVQVQIHGYELTLRLDDAAQIGIGPLETAPDEADTSAIREASDKTGSIDTDALKKHGTHHHPGLGEGGRFHPKGSGDPLPEGTVLTFALVSIHLQERGAYADDTVIHLVVFRTFILDGQTTAGREDHPRRTVQSLGQITRVDGGKQLREARDRECAQ